MSDNNLGLAFATFLGACVCLRQAMKAGRKRRLLDDTPVSKALGVFIGEVELEGRCVRQAPFISHLAEVRCVMYRWEVSEHWRRKRRETYVDRNGRTRTRTVVVEGSDIIASGGESDGFYLQDETGFVWIDPRGADLETVRFLDREVGSGDPLYYDKGPQEAVEGSTHVRSFHEHGLAVGTKIFVRGRASERRDIVAPQIRQEAKEEIFIITPRREHEVSQGHAKAYVFWSLFGIIFGASFGLVFMLLIDPFNATFGAFLGALFYLLALGLSWLRMAFNSLVGLRQRVRQAWSLIDVQLKRRVDLIQPLVECVRGFAEHEAAVQRLVADLRAQAVGAVPSPLAPQLSSVIEAYPELRAQEVFLELSRQLVETEDRIALARSYHANIASFYNTRLERVPDRFVAAIVRMRPESLFTAPGFERRAAPLGF